MIMFKSKIVNNSINNYVFLFHILIYLISIAAVVDSFVRKFQRSGIREKNGQRIRNEKIVLSETGYLQIFMYYVQTAALLKLDIIVEPDPSVPRVTRPAEFIPESVRGFAESVFDFNVLAMGANKCLVKGLRPASKTALNSAFIVYFFAVLLALYLLTGCCFSFLSSKRRPRIGSISMNSRMMMTFVLLFLYTYQVSINQ